LLTSIALDLLVLASSALRYGPLYHREPVGAAVTNRVHDLKSGWHQICCELLVEVKTMGATISSGILDLYGRQCHLRRPIRDHSGRSRFQEMPVILREVFNLERHMYLVRFSDGATTFVFPEEVDLA
jgi:hypothetical protein